jgi:hypothetical protein
MVQFDVRELFLNLPFSVTIYFAHVCKTCLKKLKEQTLKDEEAELPEEIKTLTNLCRQDHQVKDTSSSKSNADYAECHTVCGQRCCVKNYSVLTFQTH